MNQRFLSISNESMDYEVQPLNHLNLKVICLIIESVESETYVFHQSSNHVFQHLNNDIFKEKKVGLFFRGKLERFAFEAMFVSSVGWS